MTIKVKGILTALRPSTPIISSYICIEWKIKEQDFSEPVSTDKILGSKEITVSPLSGVKCQLMSCKTMCSSSDPCETELSGAKCYTPACIEILFESRVKPGNETKIYAALDYSIDSADYNEQLGFVCDKDFCLGLNSADYRERKLLKRTFFVNGVLTLNLKGIFMVKKPHNDQFKTLTLAKSFASKSALKRKNKDFLIVIGDKEIQVHKKVLLAASKSMIGNKESFDNKMVIIDFPFKIVDIAVKLIYGKCILLKSSLEDMLLLFRFGDKYRIQTIMDMVEECLIGEISPVTVVYLIKFSSPDSTNVPFLYQKCVEFFIKCLKEATPIYAAESLGEEFLESMFSKSILSNFTDSIN
uniref:BTB domain-containing protein n=1 Tax=Panagrolaimus davidi TaxID=227884 RepID=A0A914PY25_9BILA